ncbi:MAG: hypothetical protein U9M89_03415 [Patescibacteria group bacterium]|nr:hypothetical protein [Patescibacteria group bacterium]
MPKLKNIFLIILVLGLVYAELLPTVFSNKSEAQTPTGLDSEQSELLLSFFNPETKQKLEITAPKSELDFIDDIDSLPNSATEIAGDSVSRIPTTYTTRNSEDTIVYRAIPLEDQAFIGNVIPKDGTALANAYNQGGRAWYQEENNVVVIFPNTETFRSFNKKTGGETNWLQDRLNYSPISSENALQNYTQNYHGEIVAETDTWTLVKFPSGGYLKIAKP